MTETTKPIAELSGVIELCAAAIWDFNQGYDGSVRIKRAQEVLGYAMEKARCLGRKEHGVQDESEECPTPPVSPCKGWFKDGVYESFE